MQKLQKLYAKYDTTKNSYFPNSRNCTQNMTLYKEFLLPKDFDARIPEIGCKIKQSINGCSYDFQIW